jgi:Trp operon repressor
MNPYMSKPKLEKNVQIPPELFQHLLTPSEVRMLKNRWQIIQALENGLSIRAIAEQVKVGTDTVVRVSRMKERNNLRKFLKKDEIKTKTPWIFGKSE